LFPKPIYLRSDFRTHMGIRGHNILASELIYVIVTTSTRGQQKGPTRRAPPNVTRVCGAFTWTGRPNSKLPFYTNRSATIMWLGMYARYCDAQPCESNGLKTQFPDNTQIRRMRFVIFFPTAKPNGYKPILKTYFRGQPQTD
jgi:hypothetical protein